MADDGSKQATPWPLPKFLFSVDVGDGEPLRFSEVSGLDSEVQAVEFRQGNSKVFPPIKMPGLRSVASVTLKKAVVSTDAAFLTWAHQAISGTIQRRTVIITLLNESSAPAMAWTLTNAFPTKIQRIDLVSDTNDVAIGTVELAYETLTVRQP